MLPLVVSIHLWRGQPLLVGEHTNQEDFVYWKAHGKRFSCVHLLRIQDHSSGSTSTGGWLRYNLVWFSVAYTWLRTVQSQRTGSPFNNFQLFSHHTSCTADLFWDFGRKWRYCGSTWRVFRSFLFTWPLVAGARHHGSWKGGQGLNGADLARRGWGEVIPWMAGMRIPAVSNRKSM